jgi:hypothetical protein
MNTFLLLLFLGLSFPLLAAAQGEPTDFWSGLSMLFGTDLPRYSMAGVILAIANFLAFLASVVALGAIVYGGFQYFASAGSEETAAAAKKTIAMGVVGLILVIIAAVIVNYIIASLA